MFSNIINNNRHSGEQKGLAFPMTAWFMEVDYENKWCSFSSL